MSISIITSNSNKFQELREILGEGVEQLVTEIEEIQELDPHKIIRHKLQEAARHAPGDYIVEDTSLYLDCLGGKLPGPFIKWFQKSIGNEGIAQLAERMGNDRAIGQTILGYADRQGNVEFFEGKISGRIVPVRGTLDFGWGPIFLPTGEAKTFGEMTREEKAVISMRSIAARKLKAYLENR